MPDQLSISDRLDRANGPQMNADKHGQPDDEYFGFPSAFIRVHLRLSGLDAFSESC
jgi:hypothetical protein